MEQQTFIAIDLKSFYASVECRERGLDPLTTHLVVADMSRTEKTICLAVSPSLKAYGIPGRARLFEVVQKVRRINAARRSAIGGAPFTGSSDNSLELRADPELELSYITAVPRMRLYMDTSAKIYQIYLKYVAPEDIHVYSIDEVFIDITAYLNTYRMTPHELCMHMIRDVLKETGITATGGIGTNLYLAKIAMDIVAKHMPADQDGVRIAQLTEKSYRRYLWTHRPLTDFWRVGAGIAGRLSQRGIYTMGDIARLSLENEDLLYQMFGINAQHLINHAWGFDDTTMAAVKSYKPENSSVSTGQVLKEPYTARKGKLIVMEMTDQLVLDLVDKGLMTDQLVLTIGYDPSSLEDPQIRKAYKGRVVPDWYGRQVPRHAHGTVHVREKTSSSKTIMDAVSSLYDRIIDPVLLIRRVMIAACNVTEETAGENEDPRPQQMDLFTDYEQLQAQRAQEEEKMEKERRAQRAVLEIKKKYGKNAILKGMNLEEGATTIERNEQVGGHRAGE